MFEQVGPEIWSQECIVRFGFIPLPHRMTIIRLANGRLLIHSPTKLTPQTRSPTNSTAPIRVAAYHGSTGSLPKTDVTYADVSIASSSGTSSDLLSVIATSL